MPAQKTKQFFSVQLKNTFDKLSKVRIFRSIEDGLGGIGNLLLFGSLFIIIVKLPQTFGATYSQEFNQQIDKVWLLSVGLMSWFFAGTVAKYFTESLNDKLKLNQQLDSLTPMVVAMVAYLLLVVTNVNQQGNLTLTLDFQSFGLQGVLTALVVGLVTSYFFYLIRKYLILTKKETNIPGSFFDKIVIMVAVSFILILFWGLGWIWTKYVTTNINALLDGNFSFWIRKTADQWYGLPILYSGYALSWFTGIHGPTVFSPLTNPINVANDFWNQQVFLGLKQGGYQVATWGTDNFIVCFGGTGATFVVPFLMMFFAKSKQLKKVGKMSAVSTSFGANEPLLFGGPLVLNWYFFCPMLLAPIFNLMMLKVFMTFWGMRGFVSQLSWTTPGPLGIILGTSLDWKSIILALILLLGDSLIYLPSVLLYDKKLLKTTNQNDEPSTNSKKPEEEKQTSLTPTEALNNKIKILIVCAGGATSGVLANKLNQAALKKGIEMETSGIAWGRHKTKLQNLDFIILAPQVGNQKDVLEKQLESQNLLAQILVFKGTEYLEFFQNPEELLQLILEREMQKK